VGSFYPLHLGHIEVLYRARDHYVSEGKNVTSMHICPSHFTSLNKKFPSLTKIDDTRVKQISDFLLDHPSIQPDFNLLTPKKNMSVARYINRQIKSCASIGIQLIQVCGTDSRIDFSKIDYSSCIVIDDERCLCDVSIKNVIKGDMSVPKTSSTIERYLLGNLYHPSTISPFSLSWLTVTNIRLGEGAQGCVRFAYLGKLEVAVKMIQLGDFQTPDHFMSSCNLMKKINTVYAFGINDSIGWIIYDVGVPLQKIVPVLHSYKQKKSTVKRNVIIERFITKNFKTLDVDITTTKFYRDEQKMHDLFAENPILFKSMLIDQLLEIIKLLKDNDIIHRDIYYNNIVLINGKATLIDFDSAKNESSSVVLLRGSLRYYPYEAICDKRYYVNDCDLYMCSFVIYELIEEHEIYPETHGDTEMIIEKRASSIYPEWSGKAECFEMYVTMINKIWSSH
jgi:hypothetical protein